jgi:signal transduction histidine kinase
MAEDAPIVEQSAPADMHKVLVVDDDADALEELAESLMDSGLMCVSCESPFEALERAKEDEDVVAVVTDYMMPRMNGLEMLRELRATPRGAKIACLFVSGNAGKEQVVEALRLGAVEFFDKPVDPDDLARAVNRAIDQFKSQEASERVLSELSDQTNALGAKLVAAQSDLERKEMDLQVSRQARSEFLSMMGHELRTPLNAVLGCTTLLIDCGDRFDDATQKDFLHKIQVGGQRLLTLINSILDLTDFGGDDSLMISSTHMSDILEPVSIASRGVAEKKGHIFQVSDLSNDATLCADRVRLSQALRFLADNALSFTHEPSTITLVADVTDTCAIFTIEDPGIGMTQEQIQTAMEPLTQINGSLTRSVDGIGIGLPLALRFVEAHGGKLMIQSKPGEGTKVTVRVPRNREGCAVANNGEAK